MYSCCSLLVVTVHQSFSANSVLRAIGGAYKVQGLFGGVFFYK